MKIGIDARAAINTTDGIGRYTVELLKAYSQREDDNKYIIFKSAHLDFSFKFDDRFREIVVPYNRFSISNQLFMPNILTKEKLDIFHSLHFTLPVCYKGKMLMTIHDIMALLFPWYFGKNRIINYLSSFCLSILVKLSAKRASLVIVDSDHTALDVQKYLHVANQRIYRIYLGNDHKYSGSQKKQSDENRYDIPRPFIFTITNYKPYKNTTRLIEAFKIVREKIPHIVLAIAGSNPRYFKRTLGQLKTADIENVRFLGFVDEKSLNKLLKSADAFIFPSLYEGFGFPILEAMSLGTPVVTSRAASLPEVGGDAVIYVDPTDEHDIARGIINLCMDKELQNNLRLKGKKQAKLFQWSDTASQTLQIYKKVINV